MGAKGPLFILIFGLGSIVALGLAGRFLLDESGQAQASVRFRTDLVDRFEFGRVELRRQGEETHVLAWGGPQLSGGAESERRILTSVVECFRRGFTVERLPSKMVVQQLREGSGCRADEELWRAEFDFDADRRRVLAAIQARVGKGSNLQIKDENRMVLNLPRGRSSTQDIGQVAQILSTLWGGGWSKIDVRQGGRVHRFDGKGSPTQS